MTLLAKHTQEGLPQPPALEILVKLLLHEILQRVHAERNPLLLAAEAILETPPTTPGRPDLQIQTAAVEQVDGFLLNSGILKRLGAAWGQLRNTTQA